MEEALDLSFDRLLMMMMMKQLDGPLKKKKKTRKIVCLKEDVGHIQSILASCEIV